MLNIARLLSKADSVSTCHRPTLPTRPTCENKSRSAINPEPAMANPTLPTRPTEKTACAEQQDAGTERPWHCPQQERKWLVVPGTPCSECQACGRHRCFMLTVDAKGGAE